MSERFENDGIIIGIVIGNALSSINYVNLIELNRKMQEIFTTELGSAGRNSSLFSQLTWRSLTC
jgi:hypothetical protein